MVVVVVGVGDVGLCGAEWRMCVCVCVCVVHMCLSTGDGVCVWCVLVGVRCVLVNVLYWIIFRGLRGGVAWGGVGCVCFVYGVFL